jgi:hypothetical protein
MRIRGSELSDECLGRALCRVAHDIDRVGKRPDVHCEHRSIERQFRRESAYRKTAGSTSGSSGAKRAPSGLGANTKKLPRHRVIILQVDLIRHRRPYQSAPSRTDGFVCVASLAIFRTTLRSRALCEKKTPTRSHARRHATHEKAMRRRQR